MEQFRLNVTRIIRRVVSNESSLDSTSLQIVDQTPLSVLSLNRLNKGFREEKDDVV